MVAMKEYKAAFNYLTGATDRAQVYKTDDKVNGDNFSSASITEQTWCIHETSCRQPHLKAHKIDCR